MEFYVYAYLDKTDVINQEYCGVFFEYRPIYIGKGKNDRMFHHLKDCKRFETDFYKKLNDLISENNSPIILKIKEFDDEIESFNFEKKLIETIGRVNFGGLLYNMTNRGAGVPGYYFTDEVRDKIRKKSIDDKYHLRFPNNSGENHPMWGRIHSDEVKKKMSIKRRTRIITDETKKKISDSHKGKVLSEDTKNKLRDINIGKKLSIETKKKISDSKKGKKSWNYGNIKDIILQLDMYNNIICEWISLIDIENAGYQKSNVINVCNGKRKTHGGYKWIYKSSYF